MKVIFGKEKKHVPAHEPNYGQVRHGTADSKLEAKEAGEGLLATIIQSRSTNSRGYSVAILNDGSATAEFASQSITLPSEPSPSQVFPPGMIDTTTLRRLLIAIGDVSEIPIGNRVKSVSFGTCTQIEYDGKSSGDLQSVPEQTFDSDSALVCASQELRRLVLTTLKQLNIDDRVISPARESGL